MEQPSSLSYENYSHSLECHRNRMVTVYLLIRSACCILLSFICVSDIGILLKQQRNLNFITNLFLLNLIIYLSRFLEYSQVYLLWISLIFDLDLI